MTCCDQGGSRRAVSQSGCEETSEKKHRALRAEHGDRRPTEAGRVKHSRKSEATRTMLDAIGWSGLVENVLQMLKRGSLRRARRWRQVAI